MRPLFVLLRNLLIPIFLVIALLACMLIAFLVLRNLGTGTLNTVESFALMFELSRRSTELERPLGSDPAPVCFTVASGDTPLVIARNLAGQGFALDPDLFRNYVRYYGIDSKIQAGTFALRRTYKIPEIAAQLTDARRDTLTFRVIEGWRLEEIAALVDNTPGLTYKGADFLALVGPGAGSTPGPLGEFAARVGLPVGRSLEGFLFPDTYTLPACGNADALVTRMLNNFDARVPADKRAAAQNKGLTFYQAITLASIVQREAVVPDERPLIAGVYLNRYQNGQRATPSPNVPPTLDADPTIQYALGNTRNPATWWPALTRDDYRSVVSPYNTYLNRGLPPGPIANPGLASIEGVLNAQQTNYNYFRACPGENGRHRFSATFTEHNSACE